jgi:chemotaxis family two-component system response regulator Rcp1
VSLGNRDIGILIVEDNLSDVRLIKESFADKNVKKNFSVFSDGESAASYLKSVDANDGPARPDLIFLDLDLPKKHGLDVLSEIKSSPVLKSIPVIVLTSSNSDEYVMKSYGSHANCFISKPEDEGKFVEVIRMIEDFWLNTAKLPYRNSGDF